MTPHEYGIEQNVIFFENLLNTLKEGGLWLFPATMQVYIKRNNKLVTSNKKAYQDVLSITPKKIHNLFDLDLSLTNLQLN
jgi:hypothetical protein